MDTQRLLAPFREQAGVPTSDRRYGGWESRDISGHSLGHYLSAICRVSLDLPHEDLRPRVSIIVDALAACQNANGDGYVLPVPKAAFLALRKGHIEATPFSLNGVWVPFYTLHKILAGLRDAYRIHHYRPALQVALRLARWLDTTLSPLSPAEIQQMLRTEHGGMNEVLADLTLDSGDSRFLDMASTYFHQTAVLGPLLEGRDELDGLHGNTQIPKVIGLAREYELTGERAYRTAAESFWTQVVNARSYAIGGHGESEHFFPPTHFPHTLTPNTCETCNTYNMLKLTAHVFAWAPEATQMDFVERALINHLAANIGAAPGEFGYFLGLESVGVKAFSTPFDSWWCCVGTGMENPGRYADLTFAYSDSVLWINLYFACRLSWAEREFELELCTDFPASELVRLEIRASRPTVYEFRFRHPYWCPVFSIMKQGRYLAVSHARSTYVSVHGTWSDGDVIELHLPMRLHLAPLPFSNERLLAVMHGPCVLAGIVPTDPSEPDAAKIRFGDHLASRGKTNEFPPHFVADSKAQILAQLEAVPGSFGRFRSAQLIAPDDLTLIPFYQIYEEHYAVYFRRYTLSEWQHERASLIQRHQLEGETALATKDHVAPGFQQSEIEHRLEGEHTDTGEFQHRKWRDAREGGWFSYQLRVDPDVPCLVLATYWGGEWQVRNFEILVERQVIATQRLRTNRPGDFFQVAYPIPPTLIRSKWEIEVRFQALPQDVAGGLFDLKIVTANYPLLPSQHLDDSRFNYRA